MAIEYEATFPNIDKDEIRERLKKAGAVLVHVEVLQKRNNFYPPQNNDENSWVRVRDEGDGIITMSFKTVPDKTENISDQREICLKVDNFAEAKDFLLSLGCTEKSYQETKREAWKLDGAEITLDEWPFLYPFVEIESDSEELVKSVSKKLGFDYQEALFCNVFYLYSQQYKISVAELKKMVSTKLSRLTFDSNNPFIIK